MKVLVTGGAGFIGSHVVEYFQDRAEVRVLDNLRSGHRRNLQGFAAEFIHGSILDRSVVQQAVQGVDYIVHLAALVSVPESMNQVHDCVQINVTGTLNLLQAAASNGVKKMVLASSAAVYGDDPTVLKVETMCPAPQSPYAVTKLDGEYYADIFAAAGTLATASLRFFNVFGPRQDPHSAYAAAIPLFMARALKGEPIDIYGDGEQTRDFIYVKDVVAGLVFALMTPELRGVYNLGYGRRITINELAGKIMAAAGSKAGVCYLPMRAGDVKHSLAAIDKIHAAGFRPKYSLEEGLATTLQFFRERKN